MGWGTVLVQGNTVRLDISDSLLGSAQLAYATSNYTQSSYLSSLGLAALEMFPGTCMIVGTITLMYAVQNIIKTKRILPVDIVPNWWRVPTISDVPKPGDITGDGRNDWDCDGDTWISPLGDVFVDTWVSDNGEDGADASDSLLTVIGHDLNGNGRLEANEVTAIIGECREVPGVNMLYIEELNGVFYIHHINWNDTNNNHILDPGEDVWHYIYNTSTGILKIYDKNGVLVYMGSPDGNNNQVAGGSPWNWWYK